MNVSATYIDAGIQILYREVEKLERLKDAGDDVRDVLARVQRIWEGDRGWYWLLRYNAVLVAAPIDLLTSGYAQEVRQLLRRIEHNSHIRTGRIGARDGSDR
jgi:hypothetical protein